MGKNGETMTNVGISNGKNENFFDRSWVSVPKYGKTCLIQEFHI